jgi:acetoacetyl-CoA synthetase
MSAFGIAKVLRADRLGHKAGLMDTCAMHSNPIIWQPTPERARLSAMQRFMENTGHADYESLYRWSVDESPAFWEALCTFCDVEFATPCKTTLARPGDIMNAGWFDGAELNYAAHLLRHVGDQAAMVFCGEDGARREISRDELRALVAGVAAGLRAAGVVKGDRVGGYLPNCPEAVIAMLATASIGATWSSCSPDFGINGVVDRFGQIGPRVLFAVNGYYYNGKTCDTRPTVEGVVSAVDAIETVVMIPFASDLPLETSVPNAVAWKSFAAQPGALIFEAVDFDHPLFIMYSSGTTGAPKCICTATAERCCSTLRSMSCTRTSASGTGFSTSRPVAG